MSFPMWLNQIKSGEVPALNADVGGIGIVDGLYVPVAAIACSLLVGHKSKLDTWTKELGIVVIMSKPSSSLMRTYAYH